jgi:hypothetical protein
LRLGPGKPLKYSTVLVGNPTTAKAKTGARSVALASLAKINAFYATDHYWFFSSHLHSLSPVDNLQEPGVVSTQTIS